MRTTQRLLLPDPKPLIERLGKAFFRQLPEVPGVYLMRDRASEVLYVGKAKNLRRRLNSYRVANPDRMPRRHLRLLRLVDRIETQTCADESQALAMEAKWLRTLAPKFNRAGVWPGHPRHLAVRYRRAHVCLAVWSDVNDGWVFLGLRGHRATRVHAVLSRLLWLVTHPDRGLLGMPAGWVRELHGRAVVINCGPWLPQVERILNLLSSGQPEGAVELIRSLLPESLHPFERVWCDSDLQSLSPVPPATKRSQPESC